MGNGATRTFTIEQITPGQPVSFQVEIGDNDPPATCGPYTNADGLPVELLEFPID